MIRLAQAYVLAKAMGIDTDAFSTLLKANPHAVTGTAVGHRHIDRDTLRRLLIYQEVLQPPAEDEVDLATAHKILQDQGASSWVADIRTGMWTTRPRGENRVLAIRRLVDDAAKWHVTRQQIEDMILAAKAPEPEVKKPARQNVSGRKPFLDFSLRELCQLGYTVKVSANPS